MKNKVQLCCLIIFLMVIISGCQNADRALSQPDVSEQETPLIRLSYVDWSSEVASTHVMQAVIKEYLGYECDVLSVPARSMWESVAAGDQDAMFGAWLPSLQKRYYEENKGKIINLGPNLEGAVMGIAVPSYVSITSLEEIEAFSQKFENRIIGIDPGAGIMSSAGEMLDTYQMQNLTLTSGSEETMVSALERAIEEERWIAITAWTPHWKFAKWDLKYLEDPQGIFGSEEHIATIVRMDLEEDYPDVYHLFDNFYWQPEDMEQVMLWIVEDEMDPSEAAQRWISENEDIVKEWINTLK